MVTTQPAPEPEKQEVVVQKSTNWWPGSHANTNYNWANMAYPTGDAKTSAIGIEKGVPKEVLLNQQFQYELVVTNLTQQTLEDVVVTDHLGSNFSLTSSTPKVLSNNNGLATWSLGTLEPRESKVIKISGVANAEGFVSSCASVSYSSLLCSTIKVVQPKLALTKTGPAEVSKCDEFTYLFEVLNTGTGTLSDVVINDPLPNGLKTSDGKTTININVGQLAPGQSRKYSAKVQASSTGRYENKATASGGNLKAESGVVTTTVKEPKLAITTSGPDMLYLGRATTFDITVTNNGDWNAADTTIIDTVPAGTKFVSASDGGKVVNGKVQWQLGSLAPKASRKVSVTCTMDNIGTLHHEARATANCADAVTVSASTDYKGIPAILLEVIDADDPIKLGDSVTYVITATNQGSAVGTNIKIACILEDNVSYVSSTGATNGTIAGNNITFATLPSLAPKAKAVWRVVVKANKIGDVRFTVIMNTDQLSRPVQETEATQLYE